MHDRVVTDNSYEAAANGSIGDNTKQSTINPKDFAAGNRIPVGLYPYTAVLAGAAAFVEGASKYGAMNWRIAGVSASVYYNALQRHMAAWFNGEDIDAKSGLHHLWKANACIAILIDAIAVEKFIDDRPPRAPVGNMIDNLESDVARIVEMNKDYEPRHWTIEDGMSAEEMADMSGGILVPEDFI